MVQQGGESVSEVVAMNNANSEARSPRTDIFPAYPDLTKEHNKCNVEADNKDDHNDAQLPENQGLLVTQLWIGNGNRWIHRIKLKLVQNSCVPEPHYCCGKHGLHNVMC